MPPLWGAVMPAAAADRWPSLAIVPFAIETALSDYHTRGAPPIDIVMYYLRDISLTVGNLDRLRLLSS
jgi:hypothetical protein